MRNWTIKDAVEVINANQDQEAIKEIAKHFPQAFMAIVKNDVAGLAAGMNDKFTMRRLQFDADATSSEAEEADDATEDAGAEDLENMSTKQLMALCDKRGIKVPHYGKNKAFYLEQLQNAGGDAEEAEEDEAEEQENKYEGMKAMELFKLCKERGIKAETKKPAKYYIALLDKADAAEAEDEGEDDWEEDDEEETKPAKKAPAAKGKGKPAMNKPATKTSTKKAPAKEEAEDDGDDWDI